MSTKISQKQMAHIAAASFPFYNDVCKAIDPILAKLQAEQPASTEALNSSIFGRFFVAIADTFTGLLNTFKTNALKFAKPLKRSEIREFVESNKMKTWTVYRIPYDKLAEFMLDVPAHLDGTYLNAIKTVDAVYVKMDAINTAKIAINSFTEIFKNISANSADTLKQVTDLNALLANKVKITKEAVILCQKNFSGKLMLKVPFKQVFESVQEVEASTDALMEMEPRLQDANELKEMIGKMEGILKGICEVIEDSNVNLTTKAIIDLGEVAKGLALIFDSYGMAATRQMALEHNHILNINNIYAKVR